MERHNPAMFQNHHFSHFLMRPAVVATAARLGHSRTNGGHENIWEAVCFVGKRQRIDCFGLSYETSPIQFEHPVVHKGETFGRPWHRSAHPVCI